MKQKGLITSLVALSFVGAFSAAAQTYPSKPVHIIVPYPPGGTVDVVSRKIAQPLSVQTGQPFVVENKPGATGTIGALQVARSTPNGYTLMANDLTYSMLPHVFKSLPWDHERDLVPVTTILYTPYALVVNAKAPFKSLQELIAHARANPGALTFGSGGPGSGPHFSFEAFMLAANVELRHIPYKGGGDSLTGLIAGQIDALMLSTPMLISQAKGGRIRLLGVSGNRRVPALPEVPTFPEAGLKDFGIINYLGWWAPKGTPANVFTTLQSEMVKALETADMKAFLESQASEPGGAKSDAFAKLVADTARMWGPVAARAKIEKQ